MTEAGSYGVALNNFQSFNQILNTLHLKQKQQAANKWRGRRQILKRWSGMRPYGLLRFDKKIYSTCVLIVVVLNNMLLLSVLRGLHLLQRGRSLEVSRG